MQQLKRKLNTLYHSGQTNHVQKVGAGEATALQGGRAENALLAVADGDMAAHVFALPPRRVFVACAGSRLVRAW